MTTRINRRQFEALLGWSGAAIALSELGLAWPVRAEEGFTVASTGASWGEGLRTAFIDGPKFEQAHKVKVTQEFGIDSVITAKAMASCGNPPFSTVSVLQAEGNFLGLGTCLQDYDLTICTNYKDILDSAKEPPRGTLKDWFAPYVLVIMGMVYNTKEASKPGSYQDLLNPKYKGRVGIPAYGWVGNSWLQVLNKTLGGNEDNIDPGIGFLAELMKKTSRTSSRMPMLDSRPSPARKSSSCRIGTAGLMCCNHRESQSISNMSPGRCWSRPASRC